MQAQLAGDDEKDRYRTCCAVCHIKFGTAVLGVIEVVVCVTVLISAAQQVVWKTGGSQHCFDNILRDCLIFQFSHFNVTLIFDYIVIIMMIFILFSVLLLFCGILTDTSSLLLPHILIQGVFLLFSIGYFCLYAISYFYGDLYTQSRPFTFNNFIERMWLATLLLALAMFQTYLFSAVIRCSMYISGIEDVRRRRESAFERCSERVRLAKENGLWRTTSWGGGFQQYKGQYDENKPKKEPKHKGFHVQWSLQKSGIIEDEEAATTMKLRNYDSEPKSDLHEPLIKLESVDESAEATSAKVGHQKRERPELPRKDRTVNTQLPYKAVTPETGRLPHSYNSFDQPTTSKTSTSSMTRAPAAIARSERHSSKEGHRRGSSSSTSPQRKLSDKTREIEHRSKRESEPNTGAVSSRRRTSSSPRASLKKNKSVDIEDPHQATVGSPERSERSRRPSLGNERRRESTSSNCRAPHSPPQSHAPEKRSDVPHIKRVSISATHL